MQARTSIIDEIEEITFNFMKKATKSAIDGLWKLGAGLVFAGSIPFARSADERERLYEISKIALIDGGMTTAMWVVPTALITTLGMKGTVYATGLAWGAIQGGMSIAKVVRELTADDRDEDAHEDHEEPTPSTTEHILREIGHTPTIVPTTITPVTTLPRNKDEERQPDPQPEELLQFKLEL